MKSPKEFLFLSFAGPILTWISMGFSTSITLYVIMASVPFIFLSLDFLRIHHPSLSMRSEQEKGAR